MNGAELLRAIVGEPCGRTDTVLERMSVWPVRIVLAGVTVALLALPSVARADGGPVLKDHELWAQLKEAQQTAVITLASDNTADVDLFISLLDESEESHEVRFFLPLGADPSDFCVAEKTSLAFDNRMTRRLDEILRHDAQDRYSAVFSLLPGLLLTNGAWLLPLAGPALLTGCAAGEEPIESYQTASSQVDIYGLTEDTNIDALISTTGLDPSVQETLSRMRGQQIAVITLQTRQSPSAEDGESHGAEQWDGQGEQWGIHLSWTARLVEGVDGGAYAYPLGTGTAWARPIELTRVYVVAPPGMGFAVDYPRLGKDYSGYTPLSSPMLWALKPRIHDYYHAEAYAVDEATHDTGRVWRAIYTQSNSGKDIVITTRPAGGFGDRIQALLQGWGGLGTAVAGILLAVLLWLAAWRYLLPRLLPLKYRWRESSFWWESMLYPGMNLVIVPLAIFVGVISLPLTAWNAAAGIAGLALAVLVTLAPGAVVFVRRYAFRSGVPNGRAFLAYIALVLGANGAYAALAVGYAALIGLL